MEYAPLGSLWQGLRRGRFHSQVGWLKCGVGQAVSYSRQGRWVASLLRTPEAWDDGAGCVIEWGGTYGAGGWRGPPLHHGMGLVALPPPPPHPPGPLV